MLTFKLHARSFDLKINSFQILEIFFEKLHKLICVYSFLVQKNCCKPVLSLKNLLIQFSKYSSYESGEVRGLAVSKRHPAVYRVQYSFFLDFPSFPRNKFSLSYSRNIFNVPIVKKSSLETIIL